MHSLGWIPTVEMFVEGALAAIDHDGVIESREADLVRVVALAEASSFMLQG